MSKPIICCVIIILILLVIWLITCREKYSAYYGIQPTMANSASYASLGSYGYSSPLFEPDVLRRCADGSYTYSSNPTLTKFCSTIPPQVLQRVACNKAFRGRPLRMSYTAPAYGVTREEAGMPCGMSGLNLS